VDKYQKKKLTVHTTSCGTRRWQRVKQQLRRIWKHQWYHF